MTELGGQQDDNRWRHRTGADVRRSTSHCFSLTAQPQIFHRVNPACSKVATSIVCHARLGQASLLARDAETAERAT